MRMRVRRTQPRFTPYKTLPRDHLHTAPRRAMPRIAGDPRFNPADMLGLQPQNPYAFAGQTMNPYAQQVPSYMPPPGVMPPLFDQTPR